MYPWRIEAQEKPQKELFWYHARLLINKDVEIEKGVKYLDSWNED